MVWKCSEPIFPLFNILGVTNIQMTDNFQGIQNKTLSSSQVVDNWCCYRDV